MSIFPTKVLLATDGSKEAEQAGRAATELAATTGSELHMVHVFGIMPWYPVYPEGAILDDTEPEDPLTEEDLQRISERRARELLDTEVEKIGSLGGTVARAHLREGGSAQEIVGLAEEIGAGLVVVGSRGFGGVRRALMGNVSDSVVRHAHCPVMVARGQVAAFPAKILLATDASEEARLAATTAADVAKSTGSELHVVHVFERLPTFLAQTEEEPAERLREARRHLEGEVRAVEESGGTVEEAHLRQGRADEEVIELAENLEVGLIVMGSRGLGGIRRALMGSVSDSVTRHAHCPVLVLRNAEGKA